ncbi:hypothetical protein WOLCODRAFT_163848 [Wolfiporia cocos MD-104 SS10]|uniref:Uncharacterized protein n=1 Tax=Wolfiporia cocos (strain MD-104) TaxID=742152 RepID=A0A2H3JRJ4_WOLCO|nr:hypothetical protein WOLCODRAFT_163848 [Wolfiporia cocos MD-104 SS10]
MGNNMSRTVLHDSIKAFRAETESATWTAAAVTEPAENPSLFELSTAIASAAMLKPPNVNRKIFMSFPSYVSSQHEPQLDVFQPAVPRIKRKRQGKFGEIPGWCSPGVLPCRPVEQAIRLRGRFAS